MKNVRVIAAFATGSLAALAVGVAIGAQSETSQSQFRAGFGVLTGGQETGGGDRNGRGSFSGIFKGDTLCYGLTVSNIGKPGAAHIHKAPRGEDGDVVVTLKHPRTGNPGTSSECVEVDAAVADDIRANPKGFYVNVHNDAFPNGAVRGQIFSR
jgi:hypothetical protein